MSANLHVHIADKRFNGGDAVLHELQLHIEPGEFVAVLGPSGAGKSTLLNLIAGLDNAFRGHIAGVPEDHVGFVFQEPRLMPWLSARDNLRLVQPKVTEADLDRLLSSVELAEFGAHFPAQLSGGMARRVALARAFAVQPQLLLLDEPFTGLDAPTANRLRQFLRHLCSETRPSVLMVTHQLNEALALADRVLFMSTSPARILHEYRPLCTSRLNVDPAAHQAEADGLLQAYPQLLQGKIK